MAATWTGGWAVYYGTDSTLQTCEACVALTLGENTQAALSLSMTFRLSERFNHNQ